jgi:hypothetical protein
MGSGWKTGAGGLVRPPGTAIGLAAVGGLGAWWFGRAGALVAADHSCGTGSSGCVAQPANNNRAARNRIPGNFNTCSFCERRKQTQDFTNYDLRFLVCAAIIFEK